MMRIMLVDDERRILEGMRRVLKQQVPDIDIVLVEDAATALRLLEHERIDVIMSDMRMPQIDGAELLARVHARWPDVVRIVLTGQMDQAAATRTVEHAHQYLLKPCSAEALREVLDRARRLRALLADDAIRAAVGSLGSLPVLPESYRAIASALEERASLTDVVVAVERDPCLCAKVLQLASSAYFGGGRPVPSIADGVSRLGLRTLQALALTAAVAPSPATGARADRSLAAARAAHAAARAHGGCDPSEASMAALLADIGSLALESAAPAKARQVEMTQAGSASLSARLEAERAVLGADHASMGAYLLGIWGVGQRIVDAVFAHHDVTRAAPDHRVLAAIVHAAVATAVDDSALSEEARALLGSRADAVWKAASSAGTNPVRALDDAESRSFTRLRTA